MTKATEVIQHMVDELNDSGLSSMDAIGGWSGKTIGQGYGEGYPLEVLHRWIVKMVGD